MLWGCQTTGEPPGDDDAAGLLDPTRISCEKDAKPRENTLGERCCRDLDFGRTQRKAALLHVALPWPARVTRPGSAPGTQPAWLLAAAGREQSSPSSEPGMGAGREPCQHHSCEISADPPRERVFLGFSQSY